MWGNQKPQASQPATMNVPEPPAPIWKPTAVETKETAPSNDNLGPLKMPSGSTARLGTNLHVKGEISGNEDLHIDGSVEGLIQLEDHKLTVGASAKLTADVMAREVVIYGSIKGNLRARDRIEIKKDGSAVGDLTTTRIMIEDGAYFKGSIEIDRPASSNDTDLDKLSYSKAAAATPAHAIPPKSL
jgi:cytoskeletal protein CcmA (bactofilin family)